MAHNTPGQVRSEFRTYFAGCRAGIEIRISQEEERSAMKSTKHTHTYMHKRTRTEIQVCEKTGTRLDSRLKRDREMGRVRRTLAKISRNVLRVLIKVIRKIRAKIFSNGFTSFLRVCKTLEHKARFGKQLYRPKRAKAKRTSCVFYLFAVICLGNKQSGRSAQDICAALKSMLWKSSESQ